MKSLKKILINSTVVSISLFVTYLLATTIIYFFVDIYSGGWRHLDPVGKYLVNSKGTHKHYFNKKVYHYDIDENGFRGSNYEKNSNKKNIFVIGDSFSFGYLIDEENTFVSILNKKYKDSKYNFINAAIAGSGTSQWMAMIEDQQDKFKDSYLLIMVNYTSFSRGFNHWLYKYDCKTKQVYRNLDYENKNFQYLNQIDHFVNDFANKFDINNFFSGPIYFLKHAYFKIKELNILEKNKPEIYQNTPYHIKNINIDRLNCFVKLTVLKIIGLGKKINSEVIFVDFGFRHQSPIITNPKKYPDSVDRQALLIFDKMVFGENINYIDLNEITSKALQEGVSLEIKNDGHPNEIANRLIAEELNKKLKNFFK